MQSKCRKCGRKLTNPISIRLGIGDVCRLKEKSTNINQQNLFGLESDFKWYKENIRGLDIIIIEDMKGGMSVTNDIQRVIKTFNFNWKNKVVIYKDENDIWDGINPTEGNLFYSLNTMDLDEAKQDAIDRYFKVRP